MDGPEGAGNSAAYSDQHFRVYMTRCIRQYGVVRRVGRGAESSFPGVSEEFSRRVNLGSGSGAPLAVEGLVAGGSVGVGLGPWRFRRVRIVALWLSVR